MSAENKYGEVGLDGVRMSCSISKGARAIIRKRLETEFGLEMEELMITCVGLTFNCDIHPPHCIRDLNTR